MRGVHQLKRRWLVGSAAVVFRSSPWMPFHLISHEHTDTPSPSGRRQRLPPFAWFLLMAVGMPIPVLVLAVGPGNAVHLKQPPALLPFLPLLPSCNFPLFLPLTLIRSLLRLLSFTRSSAHPHLYYVVECLCCTATSKVRPEDSLPSFPIILPAPASSQRRLAPSFHW